MNEYYTHTHTMFPAQPRKSFKRKRNIYKDILQMRRTRITGCNTFLRDDEKHTGQNVIKTK